MEDNTQTNPKSRMLALQSLEGHPGWPVYCARVAERVKKQIDDKVFDPKTSDEDRRTLVGARKLLMDEFTPEKMRQSMIAQAKTEVIKIERPGGK